MVPHSRKTTTDPAEAPGSSPEAETNGPESVGLGSRMGGGCHAGRVLECHAVQGLCQLLEHHLAVLEQSQQPLGDLLQPEAMPDGRHVQEWIMLHILGFADPAAETLGFCLGCWAQSVSHWWFYLECC